MFSKSQLQNVEDVQLSLYMDWLFEGNQPLRSRSRQLFFRSKK
ncbi:hypothetical protein EIO60_00368|nr:hypothetical protein [Candidatus Pantoea persica]